MKERQRLRNWRWKCRKLKRHLYITYVIIVALCLALVIVLMSPPAAAQENPVPMQTKETGGPDYEMPDEAEQIETALRDQAEDLGEFTATAYCACKLCCGKTEDNPAYGITASGTTVKEGRTIAVDPDIIPLGSTVWINGVEYIAEDTGGAIKGKKVDIYFTDHQAALEYGVRTVQVEVLKP